MTRRRPRLVLAAATLGLASSSLADIPRLAGCPVFPADNVWNTPVDTLPVHANSANWIAQISNTAGVKADFGSGLYLGAPIGVPYVVVPANQAPVPVAFDYDDESDPGPYPIPPDAPIEGGPDSDGDRHVLVIDAARCLLYETFYSFPLNGGTSWTASSGAVFDLRSNELRPDGWTSADAAGLPVLAGLARYSEVAAGEVNHALRFTASATLMNSYLWPARHWANQDPSTALPPMGLRVRLKAGKDISQFSPQAKVLATAMKKYGLILADNGSPWFVTGIPDEGWDNEGLRDLLDLLAGTDFEVVDTSSMMADPNSGRVASPACGAGDGDGDGMPDCVDVTEGRNPALKDNDVFGSSRLFSMQQYRDFLGREGDAAGIRFYTGLLDAAGTSRAPVIEAFFNSPEFAGNAAPVVRLYFAFFNRIPDYPGLTFQINALRTGTPLPVIANNFSLSPEFQATYGSLDNAQYVTLLYQNVLGRTPVQAEIDYHVNRLAAGATRGEVMTGFSESPEYRALRYNGVYVTMMYAGMLRRSPEQAGFDYWVAYIAAGNSGQALIQGFLNAPEYRGRFLP